MPSFNSLKPAAKRFEIDYCCQLYSRWFGSQGLCGETLPSRDKNTFAAVIQKTSTIATPRRLITVHKSIHTICYSSGKETKKQKTMPTSSDSWHSAILLINVF